MSSTTSNSPTLRVVGHSCGEETTPMPARNAVTEVGDARWVFAARVAESLEGYSAAVLSPEKRDSLLRLSQVLGLRPFDANLIIAIVQDSVRCGLDPLSQSTADRLAMVASPTRAKPQSDPWSRVMMVAWAAMFGVMGAMTLIRWVGG